MWKRVLDGCTKILASRHTCEQPEPDETDLDTFPGAAVIGDKPGMGKDKNKEIDDDSNNNDNDGDDGDESDDNDDGGDDSGDDSNDDVPDQPRTPQHPGTTRAADQAFTPDDQRRVRFIAGPSPMRFLQQERSKDKRAVKRNQKLLD